MLLTRSSYTLKKNVVWISSSLLFLAASAVGQVRIQCHPGLDVPRERVSLLFDITWRVVAEEFRLADNWKPEVPVTLVVGESRDGVEGDETNQVFTIYMSRWDETMFATSVSRIALQHLLSRDRKARVVRESLRRANLISPISAKHLQPGSPSRWSVLNLYELCLRGEKWAARHAALARLKLLCRATDKF